MMSPGKMKWKKLLCTCMDHIIQHNAGKQKGELLCKTIIMYILKFEKLIQSKQHAFKGLDDYQHSNCYTYPIAG